MPIVFDKPIGAHVDVKELEYISPLHQTSAKIREDGTIDAHDVAVYLHSRHGIVASEEYVRDHVMAALAGAVDNDTSEATLDLLELTAILIAPHLKRIAATEKESEKGGGGTTEPNEQQQQPQPLPSEISNAKPLMERTLDWILLRPQITKPPLDTSLVDRVLNFILLTVLGRTISSDDSDDDSILLTESLLREILSRYGETNVPDAVIREMLDAAGGEGVPFRAQALLQATTADLEQYDLKWEQTPTTFYDDVLDDTKLDHHKEHKLEATEFDEDRNSVKRIFTAPTIDFIAENYRSKLYTVMLWVLGIFAFIVYAFNFQSVSVCEDGVDTVGCRVAGSVLRWLLIFFQIMALGVVFVVLGSMSNNIYLSHNTSSMMAVLVGIATIVATSILTYFFEFEFWVINTNREEYVTEDALFDEAVRNVTTLVLTEDFEQSREGIVTDLHNISSTLTTGLGTAVEDAILESIEETTGNSNLTAVEHALVRSVSRGIVLATARIASSLNQTLFPYAENLNETLTAWQDIIASFESATGAATASTLRGIQEVSTLVEGSGDLSRSIYFLVLILGCFMLLLQVGALLYVMLPAGMRTMKRLQSLLVSQTEYSELGLKRATVKKIEGMINNALDHHDGRLLRNHQSRSSSLLGTTEAGTALLDYNATVNYRESTGGILWVYKKSLDGTIFSEEGVWLFSRVVAENVAQWVVVLVYIGMTVVLLQWAAGFGDALADTDLAEQAPTSAEMSVAVGVGGFASIITTLTLAVIWIPSTVSTILQLRCGVIPSLYSPSFQKYRVSPDTVTVLLGSSFWASVYSSLTVLIIFTCITLVLVWHQLRPLVVLLFANVLGVGITYVVKTVVLLTLRKKFFKGLYRVNVAGGNFMYLVLEVWNIVLTAGIALIRMVILLLISSFYIGRLDTPCFAEGIGSFMNVSLDAYPVNFRKDILIHEAHRHPYIERLGVFYMLKLRYGSNFATRAGSVWRLIFVLALMPWLRGYRIEDEHHDETTEGEPVPETQERKRSSVLQQFSEKIAKLEAENALLKEQLATCGETTTEASSELLSKADRDSPAEP